MHNTVLKRFDFDITNVPNLPDTFTIEMPLEAQVHTVEKVGNNWYLWACVNDENPVKLYHFIAVERNDPMTVFGSSRFIGLVRTFKAILFFQVTGN